MFNEPDVSKKYIDRDISWLSFNRQVLEEAVKELTPLLERLKFLSIYSSNLDEFFRVRVPALLALNRINKTGKTNLLLKKINEYIAIDLNIFGDTIKKLIIPQLALHNIHFVYSVSVPNQVVTQMRDYFFNTVAAFIRPVMLEVDKSFFPENNKIYFLVVLRNQAEKLYAIINIPSDELERFLLVKANDKQYVLFLDDVVRNNIDYILPGKEVSGIYSIKITRDAELDLQDEYEGDIADKIEKQITKRDFGFATRFLYDADIEKQDLDAVISLLGLSKATIVSGGRYHNLKDLIAFPISDASLSYQPWPPKIFNIEGGPLLEKIKERDIVIHTPYESYNTVLRFFNEASLDKGVDEIYVTLYRIASNSTIANALISAAKNGKKVTVFVELKARFDEANNIKWSRRMKDAGVKIIYSIPGLKVHAKIALIKKTEAGANKNYGLFATGNFNETTARFYTDHVLLTDHNEMLDDLEKLFLFLGKRKRPQQADMITFKHLLVAQFNLQSSFLKLIDELINEVRRGYPASLIIKLNNLEEKTMINKIYEAADAGVKIQLLIRGICRLNASYKKSASNICVKRIVGRYLEHGRVFIFKTFNEEKVFLGSADWMNRNLHRRIEVCFPVYNENIKQQLKEMINLQLEDNTQCEVFGNCATNTSPKINSQFEIYKMLAQ